MSSKTHSTISHLLLGKEQQSISYILTKAIVRAVECEGKLSLSIVLMVRFLQVLAG